MLFVSPSVRERGTDTVDTMPVEEDVMDAILRAKTLELGGVEEEEEPSQQTHGLTRRKSTAAFPNGGDHAAEVAEVSAGDQGTEEKKGDQPQKTTAVETVETSPPKQDGKQNPPDELPDRPMVTRTSQRDLKQTKENKDEKDSESEPSKVKGGRGRGGKGKGRGRGLKRPAAARNPKSRNQKDDGEDEESQEVENETGATATEATQHYSPPNSPLKPQDLEPAFSQVADAEPAAPPAKKPRKKVSKEDKEAKADTSKVSKRRKETKEEDQQDAKKAKTTPKEKKEDDKPTKGSKTKKTADPEPDSSKSNGKANDDANKSKTSGVGLVRISGGPRVSFAGRICPKGEQAKHRFEVMVATYNTHVRPYVDCHSQVEVGWVQTIYPQ